MRVTVTARDIKKGVQGDADSCPIARALRRALGMRRGIAVVGSYYTMGPGFGSRHALPRHVAAFVYAFDRLEPVTPFSFIIKKPSGK